jgi:hypothetical protein
MNSDIIKEIISILQEDYKKLTIAGMKQKATGVFRAIELIREYDKNQVN